MKLADILIYFFPKHFKVICITCLTQFLFKCFLGMQCDTVNGNNAWGVGLNETFLPQVLKEQGYATHAVGKVQKC